MVQRRACSHHGRALRGRYDFRRYETEGDTAPDATTAGDTAQAMRPSGAEADQADEIEPSEQQLAVPIQRRGGPDAEPARLHAQRW